MDQGLASFLREQIVKEQTWPPTPSGFLPSQCCLAPASHHCDTKSPKALPRADNMGCQPLNPRAEEISLLYKLPSLGWFVIERPEERSKSTECVSCVPVLLLCDISWRSNGRYGLRVQSKPSPSTREKQNKQNPLCASTL